MPQGTRCISAQSPPRVHAFEAGHVAAANLQGRRRADLFDIKAGTLIEGRLSILRRLACCNRLIRVRFVGFEPTNDATGYRSYFAVIHD